MTKSSYKVLPSREMAGGESHQVTIYAFVASEPGGRTLFSQVEPPRDCCVNVWGLFDPERGGIFITAI